MNSYFRAALVAATLSTTMQAALADEAISEKRSVDARVQRVHIGGVIDLQLKQGATPSLVIYGDKGLVAKVVTTVNGDTLNIDTEKHKIHLEFGSHSSRNLRAELTLPNVSEITSTGVGSTEIDGFKGDKLKLDLDGAGSIRMTSSFKVLDARLGGVGGMTLNSGESDAVSLNMKGAGTVTINGNSKSLNAKMGGIGSLDAKQLTADAVDLDLTGLGSASVYAKTSANVNLAGMGSAKIYGKPTTRNSNARGMGSVSWQ